MRLVYMNEVDDDLRSTCVILQEEERLVPMETRRISFHPELNHNTINTTIYIDLY